VKRLLTALIVVAVLVVAGGFGALYGVGYYLSPQDPLIKSDAVIAISGGETNSRAQAAINLYQAGWAPTIIFSGAAEDPNSPSNALAMKRLAIEKGIPAKDVLLEEKSVNTAENAAAVTKLLQQRHARQVILVTSPYHQRRASLLFKQAVGDDIKIINHSTTDERWRRSAWWKNPYSLSLTISELQKVFYILLQRPA
jgi:uncharacterized SAM-binding protein YcdF (DUF218 family)